MEYYELNCENVKLKQHLYKKYQAIVEHPYGTVKRQWEFSYVLTKKGIKRASADIGFMFIAYNIRRIINILGRDELRKYLEVLVLLLLNQIRQYKRKIGSLQPYYYLKTISLKYFEPCLNHFKLDQYLSLNRGF